MTRRDQYSFILHVLLPAIENEGLTIKTRRFCQWVSNHQFYKQSAPALH